MGKKAFLFPGQGSQYVGMAKDIFENSVEAKEMILTAEHAAGSNLSHLMFNGPEESLKKTDITQPAIFVHSVVLASLIRTLDPDMVAGHSLGEYSALVASKAVQYYEAVNLVRNRGLAMMEAGTENPGSMAAVIGLQPDKINEICEKASEEGIVQCANFNSPGQVAISGSVEGVKAAMALAKENNAKLVKELVVSGAFHSPLMQSAGEKLNNSIEETPFYDAKVPVYTNADAKPITKKADIKDSLNRQLTSPVKWQNIIENMIEDGADEFYEIGPGKVLQGLVKRINRDLKVYGIDKYADVEEFI